MKKIIITLLLFITFSSFAEVEKQVDSKIAGINVFLQKAEISRTASTKVSKGVTDVVLTNLSRNVDPNSIQVSGVGDVVIMSVSHKINYINKSKKSNKVQMLERQIKALEDSNVVVKFNKEALQEEKNMILANKAIGGANSGVNWEQLENIADFFRERLVDISAKWTAFDKKEKENRKKYNEAKNQLNTLTTSLNKPTSEIVVKVYSESVQPVQLDFTYLVYNAGWTPLYDFRAKDGKDQIDVSFRANVYQNTGVDWKNIPLTLSTGNPNQGVIKPELDPWYLSLQYIQKKRKKSLRYDNLPTRNVASVSEYDDNKEISTLSGITSNSISTTANFVNTDMKQLSTEYAITLKQTILSDNKKHIVNVKNFEVEAVFAHAAVPKLDKDAFLIANMMNWQEYDWISSEINVFYDGTYVGRSYIDIAQVEDTLALSLGRDKKVAITRERIKDYSKVKTIGLNKKKLIGYEITIRNNKRTAITLNLQDQIPISKNEQIEVKIITISGAKKEEVTGFLDWDVKLKPGEIKKFQIKYEIKYPKKYTISGI